MANLAGVIEQLRKERDQAASIVKQLDAALAALGGKGTATREISAAGLARISAAQRARWAKLRKQKGGKVATMSKKRTMSAAARARIAEAQRRRWAKFRAAQKS